MADRSTAAVDVADESSATLGGAGAADAAKPSEATGDRELGQDSPEGEPAPQPEQTETAGPVAEGEDRTARYSPVSSAAPKQPVLHSGHKLARRYRLEECVTRSESFSSWRAVDEMLRRAVGVHVVPAGHSRAKKVLAAARSAALLGDPRFVQVLDAVEEEELVYVVHEWLPDATELTALLAEGQLQPYEADQMVCQLSEAMAAAHREGLAHLRLDPHTVLRTESGQYRIRGLAVAAALHGVESDQPKREDTAAIGALLYAALTQRWPYPGDAHGLSGLPSGIGLVAPDQVRAGVHRGLSELAMRALVNNGSTASRQEFPCATPEDLAKAAAAMPRVRPPELSAYQHAAYPRGSRAPGRTPAAGAPPVPAGSVPPTLPGRTGKILKWAVSALLVTALGLGSWQVADALLHKDGTRDDGTSADSDGRKDRKKSGLKSVPLKIVSAQEFAPDGKRQNPEDVARTYDDDQTSYWRTKSYRDGPRLAPYKSGVGIVYDLGSARKVEKAAVSLRYPGDRTTVTLYAADSLSGGSLASMEKISTNTTRGRSLEINTARAVRTRYVLVWITEVPMAPADDFSDSGYKQGIADLSLAGLKQ